MPSQGNVFFPFDSLVMPCKHKGMGVPRYVQCNDSDGLKRIIEIIYRPLPKVLVQERLFLEVLLVLITAYTNVFLSGGNSQLLCMEIETENVTIVQIQVNN